MCVLSCSIMSGYLQPHGPQTTRFLGPWDFLSKNTRVDCHFLFQVIFLTQGSNPCLLCLLHWSADLLPLSHLWLPLRNFVSLLSDLHEMSFGISPSPGYPCIFWHISFLLSSIALDDLTNHYISLIRWYIPNSKSTS